MDADGARSKNTIFHWFLLFYCRYQIENFEKQKSTYSSKLKEACGDQEYNTLNENLYNSIEQAKRFVCSRGKCRKSQVNPKH